MGPPPAGKDNSGKSAGRVGSNAPPFVRYKLCCFVRYYQSQATNRLHYRDRCLGIRQGDPECCNDCCRPVLASHPDRILGASEGRSDIIDRSRVYHRKIWNLLTTLLNLPTARWSFSTCAQCTAIAGKAHRPTRSMPGLRRGGKNERGRTKERPKEPRFCCAAPGRC
jgi:hypothetical protein